MDIKQLHALLVVAELKSVTRAAEVLNIVQPAVSRQLRLLEEDLGTPLFERSRHGMALTEEGRILVDYARRALGELERARAEIQPSGGTLQGIVTLGLLPSTADLLSSKLLSTLRDEHPGIKLRIATGYAGHLHQWLDTGELDATLLYHPQLSNTIQAQALLEETLWLVGLPATGLRAEQPVRLADFHQQAMILPTAPHGLRSLVDRACIVAGVSLSVVAETTSMRVQRSLVLGGHGYTVLPGIAVVDDVARGLLSAAPLLEPELQRTIMLATPTTRRVTAATRCVLAALRHTMREAVQRGDWRLARWLGDQ